MAFYPISYHVVGYAIIIHDGFHLSLERFAVPCNHAMRRSRLAPRRLCPSRTHGGLCNRLHGIERKYVTVVFKQRRGFSRTSNGSKVKTSCSIKERWFGIIVANACAIQIVDGAVG